jgi:tripartite-type tricarboxylate transporter receptor subunit TctC
MMKRLMFRMLAALLCGAIPMLAVAADAWPTKPVKMIVPFAAGGATDVVARLLAQKLGEAWGQTVVVENRAGAGGNIGADLVAKSAPDGYTILMASGSILTANEYMYKSMPFNAQRDLAPITNVASGPQVVVVPMSLPVKTLQDLISYAKANPGKVNFGSAGVGTQTHLAAENFAAAAGIDITHVPYKGESAAITDLIGGQIQLAVTNLGAALAYVKQDKLRALAVTSPQRNPQIPDVPSASEVLPGFQNAGWFGLVAPAGTPKAIIDRIQRDTAHILGTEEFRARLAQQGMAPVGNTADQFAKAIQEESALWKRVIAQRGLQAH